MATKTNTTQPVPADRHAAADLNIQQKNQIERSPAWGGVEKAFRAAHAHCQACDENQQLNVHHMYPFHYVVLCGRPDLELDPRNLMTLCTRKDREHHVLLGHLDDYESYNPDVEQFVQTFAAQSNQQIRVNSGFQRAAAQKPKHLDQMTAAEKAAFKAMLDAKFPPIPAIVAQAAKARASVTPQPMPTVPAAQPRL
jgi:hypothetical protein